MTTDPSAEATDQREGDQPDSDQRALELRELNANVAPVRWAALAMFVVYGATILSALIPLQLRDPLWHQNAINGLVNNAVIPLVGLALLQLLRLLHSDLRPTRKLLKSAIRSALEAAIGLCCWCPSKGPGRTAC